MQLDLNELELEYFPNGTVKSSSIEDLIALYYKKKDVDDFEGNKTEEHFEPENDEDDDEEVGRNKRRVFDDDERLPIPDSALGRLPFCALAEVSNGCTAIFIGPNHALTAGRCVYDRTRSRFRSGLSLYRGRNCRRRGTFMSVSRLFTVNGYARQGLQEYDYGLLLTTSRSPCWVSFGFMEPWPNHGFDLLGYPDRRPAGCIYDPAYFSSCSTSSVTRNGQFLQHRCDTAGMIGAPLMSEYTDRVGRDRGQKGVFGVNVYSGSSYNYGPRITRDRFHAILEWMESTGYRATRI